MAVISAATTCMVYLVSQGAFSSFYLYLVVRAGMKRLASLFPYRCDYGLVEGKDGIDVGDGVVDLDFEDLVYG